MLQREAGTAHRIRPYSVYGTAVADFICRLNEWRHHNCPVTCRCPLGGKEGTVRFRWVAAITLWTFLIGPIMAPPPASAPPSAHKPPAKKAQR
jgi:hypothetical protein